ncbi:MAG: spermidine/putrescine ABC transporter permease PotB [Deferribacterales bacterium]|jgi:spermidine/putrescine transport system permease protein
MNERNWFKNLSITLISSWLVLLVFIPTLMVIGISLMGYDEKNFYRFDLNLGNYKELFNSVFLKVIFDSFKVAIYTTILTLLVGYPFAYNLARYKGRFKNILLMLIIIPFWTSSLIRTYAIVVILKTNGMLNYVLKGLGIIDAPLQLMYTQTAVMIGMVYSLLPFMILPLYAVLEKIDYNLLDAANDLGANRFQAFFHVTLPLSLPGIVAGCMLVFLPTLSLFYISDLLGGAKSLLIGNFIKNQFLYTRNWPLGAAASMMLTLLMFMLMYVYYRSSKKMGGTGELA